MKSLTDEKFELLRNFIFKLLISELNESRIYTYHQINYLFQIGYEKGSDHSYNKVTLKFEFSAHYQPIFDMTNFYIMFFIVPRNEGIQTMRIRYNENNHNYDNTVLNLTLHNINKLFSKINLNLNKVLKTTSFHNLQPDLNELIHFDIEELLDFFEKKMLMGR